MLRFGAWFPLPHVYPTLSVGKIKEGPFLKMGLLFTARDLSLA